MQEKSLDYEQLGLKCGLEIHQQLNTGKLFCRCPSVLRQDEPDFEVKRRLHLVAGESGSVDVAAKHEASLNKEFTYQVYKDTNCLVELDEEPPKEMDAEALETALHIALLLNCKPLSVSQIMRKTVIDGSNTSGFQRTVLIAEDGYIETQEGRVGIQSVCLEEDSARIISREKGIFRLDRLGTPLVEIATEPDIKTPGQAREAALKIGETLRSTNVKRGIGTIRQDVNLSIRGGKRVELKGFQDIRNIERAIEIEVLRQKKLVEKKASKPEVRRVLANGESRFLRPLPGAARMYPETDLPLLKISRQILDHAKKTLPQLKADVEAELKAEGLNQEMIKLILKEDKLEEYKELLPLTKNPNLTAKVLVLYTKEISSKQNISAKKLDKVLTIDVLAEILESVEKKRILESDVKHVLEKTALGQNVKEAVKQDKKHLNLIEEKIVKIMKDKPGLTENAYMGLVMKEFKGQVSGNEAMEIIKRHVG